MKQKLIALMAIMMAAVSPTWAYVEETKSVTIEGIVYNLYPNGDAEVGANKSNSSLPTTIVIPATVFYDENENGTIDEGETYNVTALAESAFSNCKKITSVTIQAQIPKISNSAFYTCELLESVVFEGSQSNLTEIGNYAFGFCKVLPTIQIPSSVTKIGDNAFRCCYALTTLDLPNGLETLGQHAFASDTELSTMTIPDGVTRIETYLFDGCTGLTSVKLPSSVTIIEQLAFQDCKGLTSVTIPGGTIENAAFKGCISLKSATLQSGVTKIGTYAFENCKALESVEIANTVTTIDQRAFENCESLTELTIPNSVTSLGNYFLYDCDNLKTLYVLTTTAPTLNFYTLVGSSVENVYVREVALGSFISNSRWNNNRTIIPLSNIKYTTTDDQTVTPAENLSFGDGVELVASVYDGGEEGNRFGYLEFKGAVKEIPAKAFKDMPLTGIMLPSTVEGIGDDAFSGCSSLSSLVLFSKTAPTVSSSAFSGATSLSEVYVREIASSGYGSVWQGKQVKTLANIKYTTSDGKYLEPKVITGYGENVTYLTSIYDGGEEGSEFGYLEFKGSPTKIPDEAFYCKYNLTTIDLPNTVTSIGNSAFYYCNALTQMMIPNGVTSIGGHTFQYCTSLKEVTLPGGINRVNEYMFWNCTSLKTLNVLTKTAPNLGSSIFYNVPADMVINVREIALRSFANAYTWKDYTQKQLPNIRYYTNDDSAIDLTVQTGYGENATFVGNFFDGGEEGNRFGYLEFLGDVTEIPAGAFSGQTTLTEIGLPHNVEEIAADAFSGCENLETLVLFTKTAPTVSASAFSDANSLSEVYVREMARYSYGTGDTWEGMIIKTLKSIKYTTSDGNIIFPNNKDYGNNSIAPNTTTAYGNDVKLVGNFYDGDNCGYLEFKGTLAKIPGYAFYYNKTLTGMELPSGLERIEERAFWDCSSLTELIVPSTVTWMDYNLFDGCTNMTSLYVLTNTAPSGSTYLFQNAPTGLQIYVREIAKSKFESAYIWQNQTFNQLPNIKYTTSDDKALALIPNSGYGENVNLLGSFYDGGEEGNRFGYLEFKSIPTAIPNEAFKQTSLSSIELPAGVTAIGDEAMANTKITSINIPAAVTTIGDGAFSGCASLATINADETPATLGTDAFKDINENHVVNVPLISYFNYKKADGWKDLNLATQSGTLALNDETEYTIAFELDDCDITYTRTVTTDNWMGVYLPFDVDVTKVGGTYATLKSVSEGYLNWETQESGTIPACTPFIYKPTAFETGEKTRDIEFSANPATLHACEDANPVSADGYTLHGNFTEITTMKTLGAYALASNAFKQADSDAKHLKPYRVYILANAPNNAPTLRNRINGEDVTGIEGIYADAADGSWPMTNGTFNLSGQKVGQDYKGIVIVNGKKVLRK